VGGGYFFLAGRKKKDVVIVSVLLPRAIDLALRSNTQRCVYVLRVCEGPVLLRLAVAAVAAVV
jgi:hypothetical protein